MHLDRKLSDNNILNYFTVSQRDNLMGRIFGTIARNVPKERLVHLYLDIYPQNVPAVQNKSNLINALRVKYIILKK